MSMPFYVSAEQQMLDRAEFARKGISRGRSVVVLSFPDGIALVADNPSRSLRKVSEIYDRIGFAAVGRYNEFEALRIAGIRMADLRGYSYDRSDVTARSLAGQYSQLLGGVFASSTEKPYEVELVVAELGATVAEDLLFHVGFEGTITEHQRVVALGRNAERIAQTFSRTVVVDSSLRESVRAAVLALDESDPPGVDSLEVAVLDRSSTRRRRFVRINGGELEDWLA